MSDETLLKLVIEVIRSEVEAVGDSPIERDSRFVEDLGFDSIDLMGVVMTLQDRLSLPIGVQEVKGLGTVRDLLGVLRNHLRASAA